MNCTGLIVTALAAAALLASSGAGAQPHKEMEVAREVVNPVTEPAEIAEWLQRLVGRFRFDGMVQAGDCASLAPAEGGPPPPPSDKCQGVKGKSDCIGIGTGPGVQCILNVSWQDIYNVDFGAGTATPLLVSYLDPAMELYGLDPGKSAINHLLVNNKGLPEGGLGFIKGNTATFKSPCVNSTVGCYRIIRIEAKPDAKLLYMWLSTQTEPDPENTYGVLSLRRVPQDEESAESTKPAASR